MKIKQISDLGQVCAMITLGFKPLSQEVQGTRVVFNFETDNNFEQLCIEYHTGELEVPAREMMSNIKMLKTLIRELLK